MPITLEELQVIIKSNSTQLRKDFKATQKLGQQLKNKLGNALNKIPFSGAIKDSFSLKGAFAAAAGVAGVGLLIKKSIEAATAISDLSDNIGIETGLLQELSFAAEQAGVSQIDLNSSLLRFNRRLSEANAGNEGFKKSYDELGISIKDANGNLRTADEVLFDVADGIKALGNESDQARVLFNLFGDSGFKLVNLFKGGSAELQKFQKQARDLGLVIGKDLIKNADDAGEKFDILSRTLSTQVTTAVLNLAPEIQSLTEDFIEGAKVLAEYVKGMGIIAKESRILRGETDTLSERQFFLTEKLKELIKVREELTQLSEGRGPSGLIPEGTLEKIDEVNLLIGKTRNELSAIPALFIKQRDAAREVAKANKINLTEVKRLADLQKKAQKIVTDETDAEKKAAEEIKILEDAKEAKLKIDGDLNEALIAKRIELDEFRNQKIEEEIERLRERNELLFQLNDENAEAEIESNQKVIDAKIAGIKAGTDFALSEKLREKKAGDKFRDETIKASSTFFSSVMTLAKGNSKALFAFAKAGAIATATIDGVVAVQKALANPPGPPFSIPQAIAAGAQAAVNVSRIAGTGFQKGIDKLPGIGNQDSIPIVAGPGEGIINRRGNEKLEAFLDSQGTSPSVGNIAPINQPSRIVVSFDTERLVDFVEARLVERGTLDTALEVNQS